MTTPRAFPRRSGMLTAIIAAIGLLFLSLAPPASAHTRLLRSTPAQDSTVSAVAEVALVFSEPVKMPKVLVRDASGTARQTGSPRATGATVTQPVAGGLAPGRYTVAYRVIAKDGHPLAEQFAFTLSGGSGAAPAQPGQDGAPSGVAKRPDAAAAARPADAAQAPDAVKSVAEPAESGGGLKWAFVVVGLLIGAAIGAAVTFLRRRPRPGSGAVAVDPAGRTGDDQSVSGGE